MSKSQQRRVERQKPLCKTCQNAKDASDNGRYYSYCTKDMPDFNWVSPEFPCSGYIKDIRMNEPYIHDESNRDSNAVRCPYCGEVEGDLWELWAGEKDTDSSAESVCSNCGKEYLIHCHITVEYSSRKIKEGEVGE